GAGLSSACIETKGVQICRDTEADERVEVEACRRIGVRSILVLPLLDQDKLIGIFEILSSRPNAFGEREVQTLQAFVRRIIHSTHEAYETARMIPEQNGALPPCAAPTISEHKERITRPALEEPQPPQHTAR